MRKKRTVWTKAVSVVASAALAACMFSAAAFAAVPADNVAPTLADGVSATDSAKVITGKAHLLSKLQAGKIFTDPNGDKLSAEKSYYYQRSTDGGQTWGAPSNFASSLFGATTISLVEKAAGTYTYRFWAVDEYGASSADNNVYWTLTLEVADVITMDYTMSVGQDQNYKTNGSKLPVIKVYKNAGVKDGYDYVGTYVKDGETKYVYEPANYIIAGNATDGWTIKESADGEAYALSNYAPVEFTDSSFGTGAEGAKPSGTVDGGYSKFYFTADSGAYSYRGYGFADADATEPTVKLGGMKLDLPVDTNVDGAAAGGANIPLRVASLYSTSKKVDPETLVALSPAQYFAADELTPVRICPIMGCNVTPGDPYKSGNYTYYPCLSYAGGNACLYNNFMYPKDSMYSFGMAINNALAASTAPQNYPVSVSPSIEAEYTYPTGAVMDMYLQYNNFNTEKFPCAKEVDNGDGTSTKTFYVPSGNGNMTWRLTDPSGKYVTKAGWTNGPKASYKTTLAFDSTEKKTHSREGLGTTVASRDEADLQVFLSDSSYKHVATDEVTRVRAYRMWELINSDTANIMLEPDFHWDVLSGKANITELDGGNAKAHWADIDPEGTAIMAVTYDAIEAYSDVAASAYTTHGGFFPATQANRTNVLVMSDEANAGTADAHIAFNHAEGGTANARFDEWDYNYDTWYYLNTVENPSLTFTVTGNNVSKVETAIVTTDDQGKSTLSPFSPLTATEQGGYIASLKGFKNAGTKGGTVIIKMTDANGVSYRMVHVAEVAIAELKNVSNPGEEIQPGDSVSAKFEGLYRSINKISGIFNPTTFYLRYSTDKEYNGSLGQYQKMDNSSITFDIPKDVKFEEGKDATTYNATNGYVFGSMYSAANPFGAMYYITDTGVGTNFNAVTVSFMFQHLADIPVTVHKKVFVNTKLVPKDADGAIDGATIALTGPRGETVTANEDGTYDLGFGHYSYKAEAKDHATVRSSFNISRDTLNQLTDGKYVVNIDMAKLGGDAWDGKTLEPAPKVNGVFEISNGNQFAWWADHINAGSDLTTNVKLVNDIELGGNLWVPAGTSSKSFKGSFDGQNHTVKNFYFSAAKTGTQIVNGGLFGMVVGTSSAPITIKNLRVEGVVEVSGSAGSNIVTTGANVGGVIGRANYTNVENVVSAVDVILDREKGYWTNMGGVVALLFNSSATNCINEGTVLGHQYVGGVCGTVQNGSITNCSNYGDVSGYLNVGGIVGSAYTSAKEIKNCVNMGAISSTNKSVGGIAGHALAVNCVFDNCFNGGSVTAESDAGAIIGNPAKDSLQLSNLYLLAGSCGATLGNCAYIDYSGVAMTSEQLANGEVAKTLNANAAAPMFAADLTPVWAAACPTCKTVTETEVKGAHEACPNKKASTGDAVCKACGAVKAAGAEYGELGEKHSFDENYVCTVCGFENAEAQELAKEKAQLESELAKAAADLEAAESELTATKAELDAKKTALEQAESELKAMEAELQAKAEELEKVSGEKAEAEKELAETKAALAGVQEQLKSTQDELTNTQGKLSATEAALAQSKRNVEILNETIKSKDATIEQMQSALDAANASIKDLEEQNAELTKQNGNLTQQLSSLTDSFNRLLEEKAEADEQLDKALESISGLEAEKRALELKTAQLELDATPVKAVAKASYNKVALTWNANKKADAYIVTRDGVEVYRGTKASYTDLNVKLGQKHSYAVSAMRTFRGAVLTSDASKLSAAPVLGKASAKVKAGKKKATVTWKKVAGAKGYQVWYKAPGKKAKTVNVKSASKTKATIKKLAKGKKVKFKVRAKSGSVYGAWSKVKKTKIK